MGLRPVRRPVDLLESDDGSRFFWAATNNWLGQLTGVRSHTGCSLSIIEYCGTRFGQKDLLVAKGLWGWCLECCGQSIWQHLVREDFLVDHGTIWVMVKFALFPSGRLRSCGQSPMETHRPFVWSRLRALLNAVGLEERRTVVPCLHL